MNKLVKAFTTVTFIAIITRVISFIFKIYLSRLLGAEALGLYQIALSILSLFVCLSSSGIPTTLSRLIAESNTQNDENKGYSTLSSALLISIILALIPISIVLIFPSILNLIFHDSRCINLFYIMLPMVITTSIYSIIRGYFWGCKEYGIFSFTECLDELIKVFLAIVFLSGIILIVDKFYSYALAMLLGDVITITILLILYKKKGGKFKKPAHFKEVTKSSTPITLSRLFGSLLSSFLSITIPLLLVKKYGLQTPEATAEFGRASGMVMPLIFAPGAILSSLGIVLIPEIATLAVKNDSNSLSRKLNISLLFSFIIISIFNLIYLSLSKELGLLLYKDPLVGNYLFYASILMLPMGINGLLTSMLNSIKEEFLSFISYLISSVLLIITIYVSTAKIGIYSYFLSLFIFHTTSCILNYIFLKNKVSIKKKNLVVGFSIFLTSSILGLMFNKLSLLIGASSIINFLIIGTIIGLILLITFLSFFKKDLTIF